METSGTVWNLDEKEEFLYKSEWIRSMVANVLNKSLSKTLAEAFNEWQLYEEIDSINYGY